MALGARLQPSEAVLRHLFPARLRSGGIIHWKAFIPTPEDRLLSVDRTVLVSAEASLGNAITRWRARGRQDEGPSSICRMEVRQIDLIGVGTHEDPITDLGDENPAHASVDFTSTNGDQEKDIARQLSFIAIIIG